ncbi:MAG: RNA-directed DNA polymerase [Prevotella sp.]|nr:RNA-directed DNA polymerase [Prevotella sp.]MBQ8701246.1 RNA-directed DNA polymerase [Prevotella sp.]
MRTALTWRLASLDTADSFAPYKKRAADAWTVSGCVFLPAAGNRWGDSVNNAGDNGNYWSSTANDENNAYNVNFNSGNLNADNNNNRNNGYSVRLVRVAVSTYPFLLYTNKTMKLTRAQLLEDLYTAYYDARRHKRNKPYQRHFEARLRENLEELCDALYARTYRPLPSTCFIITDPKKREVFAAQFRDRVVHHLYYNYTHEMYERTFIQDSYSCLKGRGTHYGIRRLEQHIRQESRGYTRPCYIMKMDIRGYFMSINRQKLLGICLDSLERMSSHRVSKHRRERWCDVVDMDFLRWLTAEIVLLNPLRECKMVGALSDWEGLPRNKSLYNSAEGCGLPIGNLTSQLFSNVYLNLFDQFMKRSVRCRHYGRYVDDFYAVSTSREWLMSIVPEVSDFLNAELGLAFHYGKLCVSSAWHGTEFLGAWLKPRRIYASRATIGRMQSKLHLLALAERTTWYASLNSYCGVMSHWNNYRLRRRLLTAEPGFMHYGMFNMGYTKYEN